MSSEIPVAPWLQRGAKPRKQRVERTLSRDSIVDAALRVVDAEGTDAATMRRVAQELNTGAASLYAHVEGKDELLDLAFDRVIGEVVYDETPDPKKWRQQVRDLCVAWHDVLLTHRDLAKVGLGKVPSGTNAVASMERMLAIMKAGKLSDRVIAFGADLISAYVTASAYETSLFIERNLDPAGNFIDWHDEMEAFFRSLPVDRFPTIVSMASALVGEADETDGEARFQFGLNVIITGLASVRL
jgi:AcrR family transcriptional regulator